MTDACYCSKTKFTRLYPAGAFDIVQCLNCKQVRVVNISSSKRKHIYKKDDIRIYVEKEEMFRSIFRKIIVFIKHFKSSGKLIDIGAGVGLLVDEARHAGYDAIGFEPSAAGVTTAKKHFGVHLVQSSFRSSLVKKHADVIVINHVLEHVPNPNKTINEIYKSLNTGGLLVIGVPNFDSVMSKLKKDRWQNLIPGQHRWQFTISSLDNLVTPIGFCRIGMQSENHDRSIHPLWKRPIYAVLDHFALLMHQGEAILVTYRKQENNSIS